jgi:hypothetical protein
MYIGDKEGRVKSEGASRGYEFSSEESEGEENNREVKDNPLDSISPTSVTCAAVCTTACNCMPCTSTGTLNITPLDSLSTVTAPSS